MLKTRDILYQILANHTGKSLEQIAKDCDRDYFLTSEEAKKYKLIDNVLEKRISLDKK
jgi:ATP-dependent Clp protease protease subunit